MQKTSAKTARKQFLASLIFSIFSSFASIVRLHRSLFYRSFLPLKNQFETDELIRGLNVFAREIGEGLKSKEASSVYHHTSNKLNERLKKKKGSGFKSTQ